MINKFLPTKKALELLKDEQDLVFVSGCFDILHIGHISFLREAKKLGKKLLVVLHDDKSIKEKKGENRPINPLGYRVEIMKELESVDYVSFWNGWENISEFVRELKPATIAVTEGSFENKNVKEIADEVGANLVSVPFRKGASTTDILDKLGL